MSTASQEFIPIQNVQNDMIILKDGGVAMVLQTSAVNFDLLSEKEQLAIIGSFAALLNSLSFPIQIVIRSKRLDISSYLHMLDDSEKKQTNPLLKTMMQHYRTFVESTIRENEVLDKQFYVVIYANSLELGILKKSTPDLQKAATVLSPRRDQILRQLGRIGLKSTQLDTEKLIKLFYDFYNLSPTKPPEDILNTAIKPTPASGPQVPAALSTPPQVNNVQTQQNINQVQMQSGPVLTQSTQPLPPQVAASQQVNQAMPAPATAQPLPQPGPVQTNVQPPQNIAQTQPANPSNNQRQMGHSSYVVEELSDEYGAV